MREKKKKYQDKGWLKKKYIDERLTEREIGEMCKVSKTTITRWRNRFNIHRSKPRYQNKDWLYKKCIKEGLTDEEIAKICNVVKSTINSWSNSFGIRRPKPKYKNKEWLNEQYITKKLSDYEIADICNVTDVTIGNWRSKFGIEARSNAEAVSLSLRNNVDLSQELIELLDGTLLGDGSLNSHSSYSASYELAQKHKSYCEWRVEQLRKFGIKQSGDKFYKQTQTIGSKSNVTTTYSYFTLSYYEFREMYTRWYPNDKKQIPKDLILTPFNTLIWFLEDGGFYKRPHRQAIVFCTNGFSKEGVENLTQKLQNQIGNTSPYTYITPSDQPMIKIGKRAAVEAFFDYLAPLPNCLKRDYGYKFPKSYL